MSPRNTDDSWTPDHDGSPINNTFEYAQDLGQLTQPDGIQPRSVEVRGELGATLLGFDTKDFWKFSLPANDWELAVDLLESPPTTMFLKLYDRNRNIVFESRGADNESFRINLTSDLHYCEVLTTVGSAAGRKLTYLLRLSPRIIEKNDTAGPNCAGSQNLGRATGNSFKLDGSLSYNNRLDYYSFFLPYTSEISGTNLISSNIDVYLSSRISGQKKILFGKSAPNQPEVRSLIADPGYYCLSLENGGASGIENYKIILYTGFSPHRPSNNRNIATNLTELEIGNLRNNLEYKYKYYKLEPIREPNLSPTLKISYPYIVREAVSYADPISWYYFVLDRTHTLSLEVFGIIGPVRTIIEKQDGTFVGIALSSINSEISDVGILETQRFQGRLSPGAYFIKVQFLGTKIEGSPYQLQVMIV